MATPSKARSIFTGQAVFGLALIIAGSLIAWEGYKTTAQLWKEFSPYFPFSLPSDIGFKTQKSLPWIFVTFIRTVGSISAVVIGLVWFFSGIAEVVGSAAKIGLPEKLYYPELVAESLPRKSLQYWKNFGWYFRNLAKRWHRIQFVSPVSYELIRSLIYSSVKILMLMLVLYLLSKLLRIAPNLLLKYAQINVNYYVPPITGIYAILITLLVSNALGIMTLLPIRKILFPTKEIPIRVQGSGTPNLFFALFEESAKLLNSKSAPAPRPIRLKSTNYDAEGTLIETQPEDITTPSGYTGYLCLPLVVLFTVLGFSRLVHFNRPQIEMPYQDFLRLHLLDYLFEIAFALTLILAGLYFAEWARKFLDVRRYKSLVALAVKQDGNAGEDSKSTDWSTMEGVSSGFADWAKTSGAKLDFMVNVFWAEVLSESSHYGKPRYIIKSFNSDKYDEAVNAVLTIPSNVGFRAELQLGKPVEKIGQKEEDLEWSIE